MASEGMCSDESKGLGHGGKGGPRKLVDTQGSSSKVEDSPTQPTASQTAAGLHGQTSSSLPNSVQKGITQEVEAGIGDFGGIWRHYPSTQRGEQGSLSPPGIETGERNKGKELR